LTPTRGLLDDVQRRIEAVYGLEPQEPVAEYVIPPDEAGAYPGDGSRTLVKQDGDELRVAVVLEESVTRQLGEADPRVRLDGRNLGPFATLTEEVSHFVYLMFCAQAERSITQLELELQGEVDKYLTALAFLSLQSEGAASPGLREALFRRYHLARHVTKERAERYHAASRLADRYCGWLETHYVRSGRSTELTREARRFYRLGQGEKLERIARM
jgi:hypothetical protein